MIMTQWYDIFQPFCFNMEFDWIGQIRINHDSDQLNLTNTKRSGTRLMLSNINPFILKQLAWRIAYLCQLGKFQLKILAKKHSIELDNSYLEIYLNGKK